MIQEVRQKYYYPCIAKYIKKWVSNCKTCIQTKIIINDLLRTELLNCPEGDLGPEDILQIDILPNLLPSGGNDHRKTAVDVFSRYLFAYPVARITATSVAHLNSVDSPVEFRWHGPYQVEKVLPNDNYIVRRLGTNKTQLLNRVLLKKLTPQAPLADIFSESLIGRKMIKCQWHMMIYLHMRNHGTQTLDLLIWKLIRG